MAVWFGPITSLFFIFLSAHSQNIRRVGSDSQGEQQPYSLKTSGSMFHYSQISKCNPADIQMWQCGEWCRQHPGMKDVQVFFNSTHEGQAFCGYNEPENLIVLSFRSTQNLQNFIQDAKFIQIDYPYCPGCRVHHGFVQTYNDVRQGMMQCATALNKKYPSGQNSLVGHSLGGALATLAAADLIQNGYTVHQLFTFGQPRVGNSQFSAYIMSLPIATRYRVVHNQDLFVHLPPQNLGYNHFSQEIWFDEQNVKFRVKNPIYLQICSESNPEDPTCSYSQWTPSYNDHFTYHNNTFACGSQLQEMIDFLI